MGFHSPVSTDDVLPVLATLVGLAVLLLRPLPDPGPMVLVLIALMALAVCANIFVPEHLLLRALVRGPARIAMYLVFILGYGSVVEGMDARKVLVACGICAVIEAVFGLGSFFFNYAGPWKIGVYLRETDSEFGWFWIGAHCWNLQHIQRTGNEFCLGLFDDFRSHSFRSRSDRSGAARVGWYMATALVAAAMLATYTRMSIVALFGGVVVALAIAGHLKMIVGAAATGFVGLMMVPGLAREISR